MKQLVFRLTKADEAKRQVWGVLASSTPDKTDEVLDYHSSKPHFQAWSGAIEKATDGKSLGNVREMHQLNAVGKVIALNYDDANEQFEAGIQVVDDSTWRKVEAGVLTGISIGGGYVKRWQDPKRPGLVRYTAKPQEVSLVDNPANPDAHFAMVRANGRQEMIKAIGSGPTQFWNCGEFSAGHAHGTKADAVKCMQKSAASAPPDPGAVGSEDQGKDEGTTDAAQIAPSIAPDLPETEDDEQDDAKLGPTTDDEGAVKAATPAQIEAIVTAAVAKALNEVTKEVPVANEKKGEPEGAPTAAPAATTEPAAKAEAAPEFAKASELDDMKKSIEEIKEVNSVILKALAEVLTGKPAAPPSNAPSKPVLRVVKADDSGAGAAAGETKDESVQGLIKAALSKPAGTF